MSNVLSSIHSPHWIARGDGARAAPSPRRAVLALTDGPTRLILGHRLRRDGFEVSEAATGPEALDVIAQGGADVVVAAARLPGLDGVGLFRTLGETLDDPPPVVLVYAPGHADAIADALRAGVADVVVRPLSLAEVVARIDRVAS